MREEAPAKTPHHPGYMRRSLALALCAIFAVLLGTIAWRLQKPQDPLFHGRHESEWIQGIIYPVGLPEAQEQEQLQQWREFGPEGLQVLARALDKPPAGQRYRKFHEALSKILPYSLMRHLPSPGPRIKGGPRHCVLAVLGRMGTDAWPVWPSVAHRLADEDDFLRQSAINYFTANDGRFLKEHPQEKKKLLPLFIENLEDTRSGNWGLRNNAAAALKYYPDHAVAAAPALTKALRDPEPHVRLRAAEALHCVDPESAERTGAVKVIIPLTQEKDDQIAAVAVSALGDFQNEPELAIPALLDALRATNTLVACSAVWTLDRAYAKHAKLIIPEMRKAAERKDNVAHYAKDALRHLEVGARK
jgi:HEAT repeat protein